jgi:ABC-2 type transport system permease protein
MIEDIRTVLGKELKELLMRQGHFKGGALGMIIYLGVMGVYLPLMMGRGLVETPYILLFWIWFPMLLVIGVVVDSFAGERERHTLETLLASRLPDFAILAGKILSAVVYGWGMTILFLVMGLVTVNVANWDGHILMFPPLMLLFILVCSLLVSLFVSAMGVLISLRAPTVRQAAQTLSIGIFAVAVVPFVIFFVLPDEWKSCIMDALVTTGIEYLAAGALAVLAVLCLASLYVAMLRFRRSRLLLD